LANPYSICTESQFNNIGASTTFVQNHFKLKADLDFTGVPFTYIPATGIATPFSGTFDGNGHNITLPGSINEKTENRLGLFRDVQGSASSIYDLSVTLGTIDGLSEVGALVGSLKEGTVGNCHVLQGSVLGNSMLGGLVCRAVDATISNSTTTSVFVQANTPAGTAGGLVGRATTSTISSVAVVGVDVVAPTNVGGLVGLSNGTTISSASVTNIERIFGTDSPSNVGGLVGSATLGTITDSLVSGSCDVMPCIQGSTNIGGMVGRSLTTITSGSDACTVSLDSQTTSHAALKGTTLRVGGVVGFNLDGSIYGCDVTINFIEGVNRVGGLVGENGDGLNVEGDVSNSTATIAKLQGVNIVGGLVGLKNGGNLLCDSGSVAGDSTITGNDEVGGAVGINLAGNVSGCHITGSVTGNNSIGGLVGRMESGPVIQTSSKAVIVGNNARIGGLVGFANIGAISMSHSDQTITGAWRTGGLVGELGAGATVSDSYSKSTVSRPQDEVRGLVGYSEGTIAGSHAEGDVDGNNTVGGLVGLLSGNNVSTSWSKGAVSGNTTVGGLIGKAQAAEITQCYATGSVTSNGGAAGGLIGIAGDSAGGTALLSDSYAAPVSVTSINGSAGVLVGMAESYGLMRCHAYGNAVGASAGQSGGLFGNSALAACDISLGDHTFKLQTDGACGGTLGIDQFREVTNFNTCVTAGDPCWDFLAITSDGTEDIWFMGANYPELDIP
jgi:hypothetical protein